MTRQPTFFLSHGGGPWPWMKDSNGGRFDKLEASLQAIPRQLPQAPDAVLVVTGHWETPEFAVSSGKNPGMVYDYYGFPPHTYDIVYPAPGQPELAKDIAAMLNEGGIKVLEDDSRGFDHGTFTLMYPMYPQADMPTVQLSVRLDMDPGEHIKVGKLLAPLRDRNVLIVGSGLSYHNLRGLDLRGKAPSAHFDQWLSDTVISQKGGLRSEQLLNWEAAPDARAAHPREDHLIPLMVAIGAAEEDAGQFVYHQSDLFGHITASSYRFG